MRSSIIDLLNRLEPTPAVVVNYLGDVLAHNPGFARIAKPAGLFDAEASNLARFVFTDQRAREVFPDWADIADEKAAGLRSAAGLGDPHSAQLAKELSEAVGDDFTSRFNSSGCLPTRYGVERWTVPDLGQLTFNVEKLQVPGGDEHDLITYLPADERTSSAVVGRADER